MQNFYVLTGAPGTGKSTVLDRLRRLGFRGVDEPARQILAEQRSFNGNGVPENDPGLFIELLLSRSVFAYRTLQSHKSPLFFDRGIPDVIDYATLLGADPTPARNASKIYRYNTTVFFAPGWEEIYHQDDERKMTYDQAHAFGENMRSTYQSLGYEVVDLPRAEPDVRDRFILANVQT